jgi:cell wall assembly regulator SMI1
MTGRFDGTLAGMYEDLLPLLEAAHHPPEDPLEGASGDEIRELESRIGLRFPDSLAAWLRVCRGSAGGEGGIFGVGNQRAFLDIDTVLELFPEWRESGWIPIAGDGCGNYYVLITDRPDPPVGFIETISSQTELDYITATSLHIFLREMLLNAATATGWPFDRQYVIEVDPELLDVSPNPFDVD